jgi:hypothetical protein
MIRLPAWTRALPPLVAADRRWRHTGSILGARFRVLGRRPVEGLSDRAMLARVRPA